MDAETNPPCSSSDHSSNRVDTGIQTDDNELFTSSSSTKILDDDIEDNLSTTSSSCHSCNHSKDSTRRSSLSSTSGLGTPLHLLFNSSSTSSQLDSPVASTPDVNVLNGLDQLLHRITSERFLELRRIQLGDRPVTGGNVRSSLENFFHRAIHGPTLQERNSEEEANRPANVVDDVQSLIQLSRVRSALQNGFRNQLESTLSGRFQSAPTSNGGNNRRTQPPNRIQSNQISTSLNNNQSRVVPLPPPPPSTVNQHQQRQQQQQQQQQQQRHQQRQQPSSDLQDTVEASVQLLTESIATDLTRLQSLQVVNNILRTDFRQELERMVQQRVETSGNGEAVSQFIRSLPTRQRRPLPRQDRRMPIINESTTSGHDVHQLRQQLQEMKQLMAMSMEIQLDTQRAIRQEVSAIFTAFMQDYLVPRAEQSNGVSLPTLVQPTRSMPIQRGQCVICVDKAVDTVLYQCGHMCVCNSCGLQLKMNGQNCPMCRASIRDVIRAYVIDE